jgi:hypothetical protein
MRVYAPSLDRIQVSSGARRHWLIGGIAGAVLGIIGTQLYTNDPFLGGGARRDAPWAIVGGALLGAGIGALTRTEKWEPVDRDELRELLKRGSATTSDYR